MEEGNILSPVSPALQDTNAEVNITTDDSTSFRNILVLQQKIPKITAALNEAENKLIDFFDEREEVSASLVTESSTLNLNKIDSEIEKLKSFIKNKKETLELHQGLLKRMLDAAKLNINIAENNLTLNESFMTQAKSKIVVPSNLPKFRHDNKFDEPIEFLETFNKIMKAHNIGEDRFLQLLPLCLDSVDGQWLTTNLSKLKLMTWNGFMDAFISHFQNPNAAIIWQDKIRQLHVDSTGVQRYTDQFVRLAHRLKWELNSSTAIYQYKQGLSDWILEGITAAEAATLATTGSKPDVEILGKMALSIEANRRKKSSENSNKYSKNDRKIPQCGYCDKFGHTERDCRLKLQDKKQPTNDSSLPQKEIKNSNKNSNSNKYQNSKFKNYSKYPSEGYVCKICNKPGHWIQNCPDKKDSKSNTGDKKTVMTTRKSKKKFEKFRK